jgi:hypothetical protein
MLGNTIFSNKVGSDSAGVAIVTEMAKDKLDTLISSTKRLAERFPENVDLKVGFAFLSGMVSDIQSVVSQLNTGIRYHN